MKEIRILTRLNITTRMILMALCVAHQKRMYNLLDYVILACQRRY